MYYSELSGPNGKPSVLSTAVQNGASKTAGTAKDTLAKTDTKSGTKSESTGQSPAYTISQSMESLLDSLTGKGGKANGGPAGNGSADGGTAPGGNSGLDRAKQAQSLMQSAFEHGKGLSDMFSGAVDSLKQGLGDVLSALGVPQNRVDDAVSGFGDHVKAKLGQTDLSQLSVDMQSSQSQWSIESSGIDLEIQDGDRSVKISFAKSTLDFRRDDARMQATLGQGGAGTVGLSAATTTATGKSTGMIVRSEGFSADEIKDILGKLNDMAGKAGGDGMKGLAVLKPTTGKDGVTKLSLDLSVPVEGLTTGKNAITSASAAGNTGAAKSQGVNLTA
ncbi:hypothetical protein [Azospirillum sp. TSO35-2]|uniref:hypothetical protein n=1 Tax=Azospirillum sp. TSO35-2 TaxID=716796 RepID=UPI000D605AC8|nr:hypothetical protein [Azospirillum sp. TSO35-2]PWC33031.1 hypothetical protein TSO352_20970 [Azospirillum sp. TSO35-2]